MKSPKDLIKAKIIADSITNNGDRMTTMELEYPRFILSELNTHRMLSKNSASSRAIPINKMHEHIITNTAAPVFWGINMPGMKAVEEAKEPELFNAKNIWFTARDAALGYSKLLADINIHKQITNRITEPWMIMKTVISGTEWNNFFWLRDHDDAQPEIRELASKVRDVYDASVPQELQPSEWHVPYVNTERNSSGRLIYKDNYGEILTLVNARIVSASCCAQVSYRKNDDSIEKAKKIFSQLIESVPAHASPVEHQATPMDINSMDSCDPETWQDGVSHLSRNGHYWSGNLRGWIQFRKLIPNEAKW